MHAPGLACEALWQDVSQGVSELILALALRQAEICSARHRCGASAGSLLPTPDMGAWGVEMHIHHETSQVGELMSTQYSILGLLVLGFAACDPCPGDQNSDTGADTDTETDMGIESDTEPEYFQPIYLSIGFNLLLVDGALDTQADNVLIFTFANNSWSRDFGDFHNHCTVLVDINTAIFNEEMNAATDSFVSFQVSDGGLFDGLYSGTFLGECDNLDPDVFRPTIVEDIAATWGFSIAPPEDKDLRTGISHTAPDIVDSYYDAYLRDESGIFFDPSLDVVINYVIHYEELGGEPVRAYEDSSIPLRDGFYYTGGLFMPY